MNQQEMQESLVVPKRRAPVEVQLTNGDTFQGGFYYNVQRADGSPGRVIDRLIDPGEKYIPLATENEHVLINKSCIIVVHLREGVAERFPHAAGTRTLNVRLKLSNGVSVEGAIHALLPAAHSRTLDYLNGSARCFLALNGKGTTLVNSEHVVSVTEVIDRQRLLDD